MKRIGAFLGLISLLMLLPAAAVRAADKPFYEGKILTIIVATQPGGGYDLYGRLVAQHMKKYLPGIKGIIVRNIPGAGHIIGAMAIAQAKPDGLTIGVHGSAVISAQLAKLKGAKLDLGNVSWIGATGMSPFTILVRVKKAKTWEEFTKADRIIVGTSGPGSMGYTFMRLVADMLDLKNIELLGGYGGSEKDMAMMRGDIDASPASWGTSWTLVKEGIAGPIIISGETRPQGYEKVPLLSEVITEKKYKPMVEYINAVSADFTRPFSGPPGIPKDRLQILRDAFHKAVEDPGFVEKLSKTGQYAGYMSGDKVTAMIKSILAMPPESVNMIQEALKAK